MRFLWIFWWKLDCFKYLGTLFACIEWNYELRKVVSTHHELPKNVLVDEIRENVDLHSSRAWTFKIIFDGKFVNLILNCVFWCKLAGVKCLVTWFAYIEWNQEQIKGCGPVIYFSFLFFLQETVFSNFGGSIFSNWFGSARIWWKLQQIKTKESPEQLKHLAQCELCHKLSEELPKKLKPSVKAQNLMLSTSR